MNEDSEKPASSALYNARTRKPESIPSDQLEDAILSGTHSYASGSDINVVDGAGKAGSVKSEDLPRALQAGYKIERPDEYAVRKYVEENEGLSGTVKAFGSQLVNEAGMGIPEVLHEKLGDPLEVAKARALAKQHEAASLAGGATGFGASLLYGGPLFKAGAKAGELVARPVVEQVAKGLASLGMKSGAKKAAAQIITKATEKSIALGTEGAVISSPKAVTEAMLGDPEQAAETLLVGGGVGSALGFAGGLAGQTFKEIAGASSRTLAEKEAQALKRAGEQVPEDLAKRISGEQTSSVSEMFQSALGKKKPNTAAIESAASEEGVPIFTGMTEGSKLIQDASSNLSQRPTIAGVMHQGDFQKTFDALQSSAERVLGKIDDPATSEITRARAGQAAKDSIKKEIGQKLDDFSGKYSAIDEKIGGFATDEETTSKILDRIRKNDIFKRESQGALASEANKYLNDLQKSQSLASFSEMRTLVGNAERKAARAGDDTAAKVFDDIYKAATEIREKTITENMRLMGLKGPEGKAAAEALQKELSETDRGYSEFKKFLKEISSELKIRGKDKQRQVLEALEAVSPDQLASKMFNLKNQKGLQFFSKRFPEAFDNLKQVYVNDLKESVAKDGKYHLGSLVRRVHTGLEPEVQRMIFGEAGAKSLQNLKTLVEALPESGNPSKTTYAKAFGRVFTPEGLIDNLNDTLTYAALKNKDRVAAILKTEKAMKVVAEKLDTIPEVLEKASTEKAKTTGLSKEEVATAALIRLFDQHSEKPKNKRDAFKKAAEKIQEHSVDPEKPAQKTGVLVQHFQNTGAPQIGNSVGMKVSHALAYLNAELPRPYAPSGLLNQRKFEPSDSQIAQFERKLGVVMDPMSVIADLKSGTLTNDQMVALRSVYPKLYAQMQRRVFNWASTRKTPVNYPMRLRLSLFMGMPMDATTNPQSVFALQQTFAEPDQVDQANQEFRGNLSIAANTDPGAEEIVET